MSKTPVILPLLSDTMTTGRLARWLKKPGDAVQIGDVLAEVESDKAIMDVEAFKAGYLAGPLTPSDTDVPVKSTIAWIVDDPAEMDAEADAGVTSSLTMAPTPSPGTPVPVSSESQPSSTVTERPPAASAAPMSRSGSDAAPVASGPVESGPGAPVPVSVEPAPDQPAVRPVVAAAFNARSQSHDPTHASSHGGASTARHSVLARDLAHELAVELGLDPASISSGSDGRITTAQVLAMALGAHPPHPDLGPVDHIERPSPLKAAMAENVAKSLQTPTFRVGIAVDLKPLAEAARVAQYSFTLLLARACALTLQAHPDFNACWTVGGVARRKRIDIAIAMDTPDGLITPVLRHATRPLSALAADWQILKDKVNTRRLVLADYRGATFYLSNLGSFPDIVQFDAIVPVGAAAILAVAAPGTDGLTRLTLSCDHRVVAGADAARMLSTLHEHLIRPDRLLS